MSLYTYVPGRDELVELMVDEVCAELPLAPYGRRGWRRRLEAVAQERRDLWRSHRWLTEVDVGRPVLGPHSIAAYEHELGAVDGVGLTDVERDSVVGLVLDFVRAVVHNESMGHATRTTSGLDEAAWWAANWPVLAQVLDPERFPLATRVGTAVGQQHEAAWDADHAFTFGLGRILDGVAELVRRRAER